MPSKRTIMSKNHKIYHDGVLKEAKSFLNKSNLIFRIKYKGEILHNVLCKKHTGMIVNNLICETLDPENIIAKLYTNIKYNKAARKNIIIAIEQCIKKKDYATYDKIQKCI